MLTPHHIIRAIAPCVIACTLAAPAMASPAFEPISSQTAPIQDLRNADNRDAGTTSSLAGTTAQDVAVGQEQSSGPANDKRSPDARDAADGRGTFNTPDVTVVKLSPPAPVHADRGVDWADAGIGAAILLALAAGIGAGATAIGRHRRHRPRTATAA